MTTNEMPALAGKTVFVTGATGFLGGALALRLAREAGIRVRALARRPERAGLLRDVPNIDIVTGDITDAARMRELAADCDTVFHCAAAFTDFETQYRVNAVGTLNVAHAAAAAGVRRMVHVSSIAAYGYTRDGDIREGDLLLQMPNEPYNITKIAAEQAVLDVAVSAGLRYSIIRPGMIYGPRSGQWTQAMYRLARSPLVFIGGGAGHSQPIYVDDVVEMLLVLAVHPAAENEAFNCAPDPAPTWRDFLLGYARLNGNEPRWYGIPALPIRLFARAAAAAAPPYSPVKVLPAALDHSLLGRMTFKMDKARELLGWQSQISLNEGIQRSVPYLREKGLLA